MNYINLELSSLKKKDLKILQEDNGLNSISNLKTLINDYLSGKNINLFEKIEVLDIDLTLKDGFQR